MATLKVLKINDAKTIAYAKVSTNLLGCEVDEAFGAMKISDPENPPTVGDTQDLPENIKASVDSRPIVVDGEEQFDEKTGELKMFSWLKLERV
jgi:hypothetical protein